MRNEFFQVNAQEIETEFLEFLRQIDCYPLNPQELKLDGELHRFTIEGDKKSSKNGAYCVYTDGVPAGFVQDWRKGIKTDWKFNTKKLTKKMRDLLSSKEMQAETERRRAERERERTEKAERAKIQVQDLFKNLENASEKFSYLQTKKIQNHNFKFYRSINSIAIPLTDINGNLVTLQWIDEKGNKRFFEDIPLENSFWSVGTENLQTKRHYQENTKATPQIIKNIKERFTAFYDGETETAEKVIKAITKGKSESYWTVNDLENLETRLDEKSNVLMIGEGVATMAKIFELTKIPCVAAMNCGRLSTISKIFREKFPFVKILIASDNDAETEKRTGKNPGVEHAIECVKSKFADSFVAPTFKKITDGTDWDDFALMYGDSMAKQEITKKIQSACLTPEEKQEINIRINLQKYSKPLDPTTKLPEQEFIGGLFPRGFISLVVAPSGTGKTLFTQKIASDLSVGGTIFDGIAENEPARKVLIFAGEAGADLLIRRAASFGWSVNPQNVKIIDQREMELDGVPVMVDDDEGWENILRFIDMENPDIVFFDTFTNFHDKDENKAAEMKPILRKIAAAADNRNIAVVLNHHSRKRATGDKKSSGLSQDDVIGSSVINRLVALIVGIEQRSNKVDDVIYVGADKEKKGNEIIVKPLKSWFRYFSPFAFTLTEDFWGKSYITTDLEPTLAGNSKEAVLTYLKQNFDSGQWFSASQIELQKISAKLTERQVRRILSNFVTTGQLKKRGERNTTEYMLI